MWIRFALLAVVAVGILLLLRSLLGRAANPGFKCETCIHCRRLFGDGVMCGFREKEVFKTPAQIEMCPDHERGQPA